MDFFSILILWYVGFAIGQLTIVDNACHNDKPIHVHALQIPTSIFTPESDHKVLVCEDYEVTINHKG